MGKFILSAASIMMLATPLTGCSDDSEIADTGNKLVASAKVQKTSDGIESALNELLSKTGEDFADGGYIIYSAEDDKFMVLSDKEYSIYSAMTDLDESGVKEVTVSNNGIKKAPQGKGWINAGTCKDNKVSKTKMALKIANMVPDGKSFELHAEYNNDGTYTVWYRII